MEQALSTLLSFLEDAIERMEDSPSAVFRLEALHEATEETRSLLLDAERINARPPQSNERLARILMLATEGGAFEEK